MIQVTFDSADVVKQLRGLASEAGLEVRDLMHDQMRLYCQDMIKSTPPFGTKGAAGKRGTGAIGQGKKAVADDLNKLFAPVDNPVIMERWKDELMQRGDLAYTTTKRGLKRVTRKQVLTGLSSEMSRRHKRERNIRGRVRRQRKRNGQDAFDGKALIPRREFNKYVRSVQKKVGTLKAGWVPGLEHYQRLSHAPGKVPAALRKVTQRGHAGGRVNKNGSGELYAVNDNNYMSAHMENRAVKRATAKRQRDITKHLHKRVEGLAKRFNEGKASA